MKLFCHHEYEPVIIGGGSYNSGGTRVIVGRRTIQICRYCGTHKGNMNTPLAYLGFALAVGVMAGCILWRF